jgi:hypothetical protein
MNITGLWANDGGDKVTQDELRIAKNTQNLTGKTINRTWDGNKISVFGARNEVVSFNLTLEAASQRATDVSVEFNTLTGPGGAKIASTGTDPLNWTNRPIELFYTRYLKINGLSFFGYAFEESQIPKRFQAGSQQWNDRPDHDKMYPDPLVPMELVKKFDIAQGQNQSVWADIYIPKTATPGVYQGTVKVLEGGAVSRQIPVQLTVFNFALPDQPTSKTVINLDCTDIMWRYVAGNGGYVNWGSPEGRQVQAITDKYYQVFHRHKLSLLGDNESPNVDRPPDSSMTRLDGSLYTAANGYDGPGVAHRTISMESGCTAPGISKTINRISITARTTGLPGLSRICRIISISFTCRMNPGKAIGPGSTTGPSGHNKTPDPARTSRRFAP